MAKPEYEKRYSVSTAGHVIEVTGHSFGEHFYLPGRTAHSRSVTRKRLSELYPTRRAALRALKTEPGFYIQQRYESGVGYKYKILPCLVALQPDGGLSAIDPETGCRLSREGYRTRAAARRAHIKAAKDEVSRYRSSLKREQEQLKEAKALR